MENIDWAKYMEEERDFLRRRDILDSQYRAYTEAHPHQWIALAEGDVYVLAASHQDLLAKLDDRGLSRDNAAVSYLNPAPVKLAL